MLNVFMERRGAVRVGPNTSTLWATGHAATNGVVWEVPGAVVITYADGEGGERSVRACRVRRSGLLSAWSQRHWARAFRAVQWLAGLRRWIGCRDGRWRASQT